MQFTQSQMFIICITLLQLIQAHTYEGCSEMTLLRHLLLLPWEKDKPLQFHQIENKFTIY